MPLSPTDVQLFLTTRVGAAGNSTAGTPAGSLGKYISTTPLASAVLNNLFDDVTGDENAASDVEYRCLAYKNNHGTLTAINAVAYIPSEVAGGTNIAIGVDPTAASPVGSSAAQGLEIADESTAPAGVVFSAPTTKPAGLVLGDVPPGHTKFIWLQRTATNSSAVSGDGGVLRIECDSLA